MNTNIRLLIKACKELNIPFETLHHTQNLVRVVINEKPYCFTNLISDIENFVQPIFQEIILDYAGVDIALDKNGNYWLIEINSQPTFNIFIRDNGEAVIVEMFKKMLKSLGSH
jgi:hypothetical protein